ncbi:sce7726 family protein [Sinorhizobium numidicum]|uniref:Sce7726 family protein n=1 Tax=Sinorhizobium numidicum TaxID=680248 RepID=A0ABY8D164_9HYPH|nr:sce7726 family protein [Sinorhizobium numidicum]WEX77975.1 sce7726 family protein [Sinorhizobium numidicum]WEX84634.1 sce7726 family protein [Sinorhizobium numidicum]
MDNGTNSISATARLREPEIKAALIDALFADGRVYDDTVVISEMPVAFMARRADIVLANGHLVGFEIKSDGDKTSRLMGQLEAYQKAFEGIVIVTGARHLDEVLECTPEAVGVVAVDQIEADLPKARMVRKPHLRSMSIETAIAQMRADDLYRLASKFAANSDGARDRFTLEARVRTLPLADVRRAALAAVKTRYRRPFEEFADARKQHGTLTALPLLRRPAWNEGRPAVIERRSPDVSDAADLASLALAVRPRRMG